MLSVLPVMRMVLGEGSEMFCTSLWYHSIVTGSGGPTASQVRSKGVFRVTFTSLGCFVNVGKPEGGRKKISVRQARPHIQYWRRIPVQKYLFDHSILKKTVLPLKQCPRQISSKGDNQVNLTLFTLETGSQYIDGREWKGKMRLEKTKK